MPIMRSPRDTADKIRHLIEGKVFCDLGSAGGVVIVGALKYASRAFGVERSRDALSGTKRKGLDVIDGDVMTMELPPADVYYCWISHDCQREMIKRWNEGKISGTLVIGAEQYVKEEWEVTQEIQPDEVIEWEYNEGTGLRDTGRFRLCVFNRKAARENTA